ncbi:MAG: hypothetical protein ACTHJR_05465 [Sphingomonas sp.]|uniref:hypothetical protein n=1 Tax=Sphingomonas sp. TaxID=28214 RepID=UPI003F7FFF16
MPANDAPPLLCRIFGHRRSRRIWQEHGAYRAQCKRCGIDMIRPRGASDWETLPAERN